MRAAQVLLAATIALSIVGCRPLYLPPAPAGPAAPAPVLVASTSTLRWSEVSGRLELRLSLAGVAEPDWLAVQWFSPAGVQVASASVWLDPDVAAAAASGSLLLVSPSDVELTPGEWRALVSLGGQLLRQFRAEVPAPPSDP